MKIDRPELLRALTRSLFGIAVTAIVFSALVGALSLAAFLQVKLNDPLASPALVTLYERLRQNPEDETLKAEIRGLDLLARRAYFTSRGQAASGGLLAFAGAATAVLAWAAREVLKKKSPASPKGRPQSAPFAVRLFERRLVAAAGIALMAGSLVFVFAVAPLLDAPPAGAAAGQTPPSPGPTSAGPESAADGWSAAAWPNFRGPFGRSIAPDGEYPVAWDGKSGRGILWKKRLPLPGNNSPVAAAGRVFLSGAVKTRAEIWSYDAATGKPLFAAKIAFSPEGSRAKVDEQNVGFAASTLAVAPDRVAGIFAGGDVVCLDWSGRLLWRENLGLPEMNYGYSSSPLVWNGLLIVQYDNKDRPRLIALDLDSGETRWEKERDVLSSWASPTLMAGRGRPAVVVSSNPFVTAYDAASGDELWSVELLTGEIGASPAYADGLVFAGNDPGVLAALRADDGRQLWEYWDDLPAVSSPVVADGLLVMASSAGVVTCLDAKTGKLVWREEFTDGFYASPAAAGGADKRLYALDREGVTHILAWKRELERLGSPALGEPAEATPAFADGRIFIRGKRNLYCIGK